MPTDLRPGQCYPLGANFRPGGANFAVFSKNGVAVELLLFDRVDDAEPARVIRLSPHENRTFYYWHVFVPRIQAGQLYGYRVQGPFRPDYGHRYDGDKLLLDPYSRVVMYPPVGAQSGSRGYANALKSVVMDPRAYNWEADAPLRRPLGESIIYEMHLGGFSRHPSSGVEPGKRGTYAGMIEKIPYLVELGVTAVELLPVQQHLERFPTVDGSAGRTDYWGYNPIAFFAPHRGYSARRDALGPADEFRDLVKALHRSGIEVILDMVFNHTAEGDDQGPTLCFRGFENRAYYILNDGQYANFTGCGNTFNGNHSIVRRLILECLHYWVQVMHVDGFRFDLASVLARDEDGHPLKNPPILWEIESDPVLAGCKIIAEAWDAAGLYQVGSFIGDRWAEWNGQFRDDVRRFVKSDPGTVARLAQRIHGSPDIYVLPDREPHRSINFITCHDGFTLHDLVSYNQKHNEANGESNRDGSDSNWSWNCGSEGVTSEPHVVELRSRQMKNLLTILMLSQGTPMLLMGDEVSHSQCGNNNAYCQDNELNWLDWSAESRQEDMLRFVQKLIRLRKAHSIFAAERFWSSDDDDHRTQGLPSLQWHGVRLHEPDWGENSHSLAFTVTAADEAEKLHVMLNAYWEPLSFELPELAAGKSWRRALDTSIPAPHDIAPLGAEPVIGGGEYAVGARAVVVLTGR